MPNWCNNEVTVTSKTGNEDDLRKLKEFVRNDEPYHGRCSDSFKWILNPDTGKGESVEIPNACEHSDPFKDSCDKKYQEFSFEEIIPMPKELRHTASPVEVYETQEDLDKHLDELQVKYAKDDVRLDFFKSIAAKAMTREYSDSLKNMYGADNWYDWANEQWGTKWNPSDSYCEDGGWLLKYDFDTAWCPPENICYTLRDMFPDLQFTWFFREEGMEMAGYL